MGNIGGIRNPKFCLFRALIREEAKKGLTLLAGSILLSLPMGGPL